MELPYRNPTTLMMTMSLLVLLLLEAPTSEGFVTAPSAPLSWTTTKDSSSGLLRRLPTQAVRNKNTPLLAALSSPSSRATAAAQSVPTPAALDWSFLNGRSYLITCPNADPGATRLRNAEQLLDTAGVWDNVSVKAFATDDEDRIRGRYTSHISVLQDALKDCQRNTNRQGSVNAWKLLLENLPLSFGNNKESSATAQTQPTISSTSSSTSSSSLSCALILEDNLALTGPIRQSVLDTVADFCRTNTDWDVLHLAYIPYVPNLVVSQTDTAGIVQLSCGIGSALGTTAYIVSERGMQTLVDHHSAQGYYASIPDVMAELFPNTRYAVAPTLFTRAPKTKSLVNPQLDDLRSILFQPAVSSLVQVVLSSTGQSTNNVLFGTVGLLLLLTGVSARTSFDAAYSLLTTGTYDGPILLAILSLAFTVSSLGIVAQGALLAPPPPETRKE